MIYALIIIWFFAYCYLIARYFGVQVSISQTYYTLNDHKNGLGAFFVIWLWVWLIALATASPNYWYNIAIGIELFVGAYPAIQHKPTSTLHIIASYAGIVFGLVGASVYLGLWWYALPVIALAALAKYLKMPNYIWWVEVLAFLSIISPLLF